MFYKKERERKRERQTERERRRERGRKKPREVMLLSLKWKIRIMKITVQ